MVFVSSLAGNAEKVSQFLKKKNHSFSTIKMSEVYERYQQKLEKEVTYEEKFNISSPCGFVRLDKHLRERWLNHLDPKLKK